MAIHLECINVIVPISVLKRCKGIGNVGNFLHETVFPGSGSWNDEHLYREGAMNSMDVALIVEKWKKLGIRTTKGRGDNKEWLELCVVDTFNGPTLPCNWLAFDADRQVAWFQE